MRVWTFILLMLALSACDKEPSKPRDAKSYTQGAGGLQRQIETKFVVQEKMWEQQGNELVKHFQIKYGRNPESIDELNEKSGGTLHSLPKQFEWVLDPSSGKVSIERAE